MNNQSFPPSSKSMFLKGFKNASFMSAGTLLSQIIGFIGLIFLTRLFGPENYGKYVTVLVFVAFFHLVVLNGLSKIVVREGSKANDRFHLVLERTIGLRLFFVLAAFIICIISSFFTAFSTEVKLLIILFSAEVIHFGLDSFFGAIYQTKEKMEYISFFSVLTRILVTGFSILLLYLGAGIAPILMVNLGAKFSVLILNYFVSKKFVKFNWILKLDFNPDIIKPLIIFSLMGFIHTLAVRIDVLMVSFLSTSKDVGLYNVAHELGREGLILRNIIAVAFFPAAVKYFINKKIKANTLFKYGIGLSLLVFAGCIGIYFFGEKIVLFLFGSKYVVSGQILRYLVFFLPFTFFSLPFATCLQATHNEKVLLWVYTVTAFTNIPLNLLLYNKFGLVGIAYSTVFVFFVEAVLIAFLSYKRLNQQGYLI